MSDIRFEIDPASRTAMRSLLLLQIAELLTVIGLLVYQYYALAFFVFLLAVCVSSAILLRLYFRYRMLPAVEEKRSLEPQIVRLLREIKTQNNVIQFAATKRKSFKQAQEEEIEARLFRLQSDHIQRGLAASFIGDAAIPGIGPQFRERLAFYGIVSAAHVSDRLAEIPGFGATRREALIDWRAGIRARLDGSKPVELPREELEGIRQKYLALHQENDAHEKMAQIAVEKLENELRAILLRLDQLAPVTFGKYLSKLLMRRRSSAVLGVLFFLTLSQIVSGVYASASAIVALLPTTITTPGVAPTIVDPTATPFTPLPTTTAVPAFIPLPPPAAVNPLQGVSAICKDGMYAYSQRPSGACARLGGAQAEDVSARNITDVRVLFIPGKRFKPVLDTVRFQKESAN